MHTDLIESLSKVADLSLISGLADERLGFADQNAIHVFIPDIHLITKKRLQSGGFKFSTNYPDLLTKVLKNLKTFKASASKSQQDLYVYQVGDLLDLWRETAVLVYRFIDTGTYC